LLLFFKQDVLSFDPAKRFLQPTAPPCAHTREKHLTVASAAYRTLPFLLAAGLAHAALPHTVEEARPDGRIAFDVILPLPHPEALEDFVARQHNPGSPEYHHWLTPAEFASRFGPEEASFQRAHAALQSHGFTATRTTRGLHATGAYRDFAGTFATRLHTTRAPDGTTRLVRDRAPALPAELADLGAKIYAFSPHAAHIHSRAAAAAPDPLNRAGATGAYWWDDLRQAYGYPSIETKITIGKITRLLDGSGAAIAIVMSSDVLDSDIAAIFTHERWAALTHRPIPKLAARHPIDGAGGTGGDAFYEASLDVQMALAGAPGAAVSLTIIPDLSDGSIIAGLTRIIDANQADIVSLSFGACELAYTAAYNGGLGDLDMLQTEHELFLQGNAQGISFIASSGDNGGRECPDIAYYQGQAGQFVTSVAWPASDPNVTAVGGTNLVTPARAGALDSAYVSENAWSDPEIAYDVYGFGQTVSGGVWGAGGGFSVIFARPAYQALVRVPGTMRAIPDIGMQVGGCPLGLAITNPAAPFCTGGNTAWNGGGNSQRSSVVVYAGGIPYALIGTSVAAPEFAGATALLVETHGRMGNLNPYLYQLAARQAAGQASIFRKSIPGFNGLAETKPAPDWGQSVGLGTPIVRAFIGEPGVAGSGNPQTAANP
jgi:subtilase family serine protease